ncbi:MAG: hypothetical protein C0410_09200 [Anaerolinea sp.]|nr:hypothetical protein [Anaerolinea sp.]
MVLFGNYDYFWPGSRWQVPEGANLHFIECFANCPDKMINQVLRNISIILIITLVSANAVLVIGLISQWQTNIQFSDGYFYGGGVLLVVGLVNAMGARSDDRVAGLQNSRITSKERQSSYQLLTEDIAKGKNRMAYLGISGLLLWGIAGLIPLIWK